VIIAIVLVIILQILDNFMPALLTLTLGRQADKIVLNLEATFSMESEVNLKQI